MTPQFVLSTMWLYNTIPGAESEILKNETGIVNASPGSKMTVDSPYDPERISIGKRAFVDPRNRVIQRSRAYER